MTIRHYNWACEVVHAFVSLLELLHQAARILTRTPRCDHITEVLINLHWLKVTQRIIYKILILTYKSFVDLSAPLYLRELVKKTTSQQIHD